MPRHSSIKDEAQLAKSIVDELTADEEEAEAKPEKNLTKDGKARIEKPSPKKRKATPER